MFFNFFNKLYLGDNGSCQLGLLFSILLIQLYIDNQFLSRDSLAFRKYLETITPDMDMTTKITSVDGKETSVVIPITLRFFWPAG